MEGPAASQDSQTAPGQVQTKLLLLQLTLINQLQLRRDIIYVTHDLLPRGWKETPCLPCTQTFSKNAAGFLLGSTVTSFTQLPEMIQAFRAGESARASVHDMPFHEEGDSSCHSAQIMYLPGQRERTMPKGKRDFVVREWRALLPVLISAYGCDANIKRHIKRQCSETALDPCLPLHRQAPSPVGSLLPQPRFKSGQNRDVILAGSSVPLSNESALIRT